MWSSLFLWFPIFSHSPPICCPVFLLECQFQRCHQTQRQCPSVDFFSSLHSWMRSYLSNKSLILYSLLLFCFPSQTLTNTERFSFCLHNMARLTSTDILPSSSLQEKVYVSFESWDPFLLDYLGSSGHFLSSFVTRMAKPGSYVHPWLNHCCPGNSVYWLANPESHALILKKWLHWVRRGWFPKESKLLLWERGYRVFIARWPVTHGGLANLDVLYGNG